MNWLLNIATQGHSILAFSMALKKAYINSDSLLQISFPPSVPAELRKLNNQYHKPAQSKGDYLTTC